MTSKSKNTKRAEATISDLRSFGTELAKSSRKGMTEKPKRNGSIENLSRSVEDLTIIDNGNSSSRDLQEDSEIDIQIKIDEELCSQVRNLTKKHEESKKHLVKMQSVVPARTFHGKPTENVKEFIKSISLNFAPHEEIYTDPTQREEARLSLLRGKLRGKAATWCDRQPESVTETWEKLTSALKVKYDGEDRREDEKRDAEDDLLDLKQRSMTLKQYIKKGIRLSERIDVMWDKLAAKKFIKGIRDNECRMMIKAIGSLKDSYTLKEAISAAKSYHKDTTKKKKDRKRVDSSSESDSSELQSSSDDSSSEESDDESEEENKKKGKGKSKSKKVKSEKMIVDKKDIQRMIDSALKQSQLTATNFSNQFAIPQQTEVFAVSGNRPQLQMQQSGYREIPYNSNNYNSNRQQPPQLQLTYGSYQNHNNQSGQPSQSSQRYGRPKVTCYRCGVEGHVSLDCQNPPLPREEQYRVRERIERERSEATFGRYGVSNNGPNNLSEARQQGDNGNGAPRVQFHPSNDVREVSSVEIAMANNPFLENMTVPEVDMVEWFGVNAVEKRRREESESSIREQPPKGKQRSTTADTPTPMFSKTPTGEPEVIVEMGETSAYEPPGPSKVKKSAAKAEPPVKKPIRMMKDIQMNDLVAKLRDTEVKGLTYGELFEIAPSMRRDVARGLVQERAPRKKAEKPSNPENNQVETIRRAFSETRSNIANFYTFGKIKRPQGHYEVKKILIDGGSVVNLIPEYIVNQTGLEKKRGPGLWIKIANGGTTAMDSYVDMELEIAGVVAPIRCYVMPGPNIPSYGILLSRSWLFQCQAKGDYKKDTYVIKDIEGREFSVPSIGTEINNISPKISRNSESVSIDENDIEEEEWLLERLVSQIEKETAEEERVYDAESESETDKEESGKASRY